MAAFLLRSVDTSTRRCSLVVASGQLSRNLLHYRFMASSPSCDQTLDALCNQSRCPADAPGDVKPNHGPPPASSKAHLYVDVATALRCPSGTFTRDQMFEIWCKNFPKHCSSEKEKLYRFKLFNEFLDYEIENQYRSTSSNNDNNATTALHKLWQERKKLKELRRLRNKTIGEEERSRIVCSFTNSLMTFVLLTANLAVILDKIFG